MELTRAEEQLLVALAAGDFGDLLDMVTSHNAVLREAEELAAQQASTVYLQAIEAWALYLAPIVQNNPGKTFAEIAARQDVQLFLVTAIADAQEVIRETVTGGWVIGQELGIAHVLAELGVLDLELPDLRITPESAYLVQLLTDLDVATNGAVNRILDAAQEAFDIPELDEDAVGNIRALLARQRAEEVVQAARAEARKLSTSASRAGSVAVNRGYSEKQLEGYITSQAQSGVLVKKVWVTNFSPTTCPHCASLHGTVTDVIASFDSQQTFARRPLPVYQDLLTPPRHPNCRCRLMPFVDGIEGDISPSTMRAFATEWALNNLADAGSPPQEVIESV